MWYNDHKIQSSPSSGNGFAYAIECSGGSGGETAATENTHGTMLGRRGLYRAAAQWGTCPSPWKVGDTTFQHVARTSWRVQASVLTENLPA